MFHWEGEGEGEDEGIGRGEEYAGQLKRGFVLLNYTKNR